MNRNSSASPALGLSVALVLGVLVALVAACGGSSASPSPSGSVVPSPSGTVGPSPSGTWGPSPTPVATPTGGAVAVTSHAQAAALVLASDPRFERIGPQQFDMIGQCCWYEVSEASDGWQVDVTIGSGDCMAGCIDRQWWHFNVSRDGTIELLSEEGAAEVEAREGVGPASATIHVVAGPSCPVETSPPDPNCQPRPVVGAEIVVRAPDGSELARGISDQDGRFLFSGPAGSYWLEPQPVEGLMGTAAGIAFRLGAGDEALFTIYYDTGIR